MKTDRKRRGHPASGSFTTLFGKGARRSLRLCGCLAVLLATVLATAPAALGQVPDPVATRAGEATPTVPKLVFALYYPWYGLKAVSGTDRHVAGVDPIHQKIANFAHYPLAGPYDSTDPVTINRHLSDLKGVGVDVLAVSWGGASDFRATALQVLMPLANAAGLKVCLFVEGFERVKLAGDFTSATQELAGLMNTIGRDPAYLRVGGKPVVFVYTAARDQIGNRGWAEVQTALEGAASPGIVSIGDVEDGAKADDPLVFDGLHYNNPGARAAQLEHVFLRSLMSHDVRLGIHRQTAAQATTAARSHARILVATVSPGFDDRELGKDGINRYADRESGQFYKDSWDAATASSPDWILIQSYNQWHDGTEIEPSVEFGNRFLNDTREYIRQFKQGLTAQQATSPAPKRLRPVAPPPKPVNGPAAHPAAHPGLAPK